MWNTFKVKDGSIYKKDGTEMKNIAVVLDKSIGLLKYGEADEMDKYFNLIVTAYRYGTIPISKDIMCIKFGKLREVLQIEDFCTILNYITMCSASGERIIKLLNMDKDSLVCRINELRELGY